MDHSIIITILACTSIPPALSLRFGGSSQSVRIEYHPYLAAIEWNNTFRCNGAIVSRLFVLTVMNCAPIELLLSYLHRFQIRVGVTYRDDNKGPFYNVSGFYAEGNHTVKFYDSRYTENFSQKLPSFQDLVILQVSEPFTYSNTIKPVVINSKNPQVYDGKYVFVSGWGPEPTKHCDSSLRHAMARLIKRSDCKIKNLKSHEICTDHRDLPEEDTYESDVGDLMTSMQGELLGIVTDDRCCQKTLQSVVYSDVSVFYRSKGKEFIMQSDVWAETYYKVIPDYENSVFTHHYMGYVAPHY